MATRDLILHLGQDLFRTRGFNAFSYYDLADALKVRPAAIHYHFPSKDDLARAIIEQERETFHAFAVKTDRLPDQRQRLRRFVHMFAEHAEAHRLCLLGASGADYASFGAGVHREIQRMATDILAWLERTLQEGRKAGRLAFEGTAHARALMVATNMAASLHLARILGTQEFKRVSQQLLSDLTARPTP
ncbi:MAG: TetR/AcrR family transcriptional regulator [Bacteroidetes bacterium]|nr:TetR/AcrR family transcriptional regulator [Bacteroidota bacterium]